MKYKLQRKHIKNFIENYGDGDIFISYCYLPDGTIQVDYLPGITKFASENAIKSFIPKILNNDYKYKEYVRKIILSDYSAKILNKKETTCTDLERNYIKFLQDFGYIKKRINELER